MRFLAAGALLLLALIAASGAVPLEGNDKGTALDDPRHFSKVSDWVFYFAQQLLSISERVASTAA